MEAIKKKMQAMKAEKENAVERAETAEQEAKEANAKAEKVSRSDPTQPPMIHRIIFLSRLKKKSGPFKRKFNR